MKIKLFSMFLLAFAGCSITTRSSETPAFTKMPSSFEECVKAGFPVLRTYPPRCLWKKMVFVKGTSRTNPSSPCRDSCGNGICDKVVCLGLGCPCAEDRVSCPKDCGKQSGQ